MEMIVFKNHFISGITPGNWVIAADLDGDDDKDVLSASAHDHKIAWYENDGHGSFGPQQVITTNANGAEEVFAEDLVSIGGQVFDEAFPLRKQRRRLAVTGELSLELVEHAGGRLVDGHLEIDLAPVQELLHFLIGPGGKLQGLVIDQDVTGQLGRIKTDFKLLPVRGFNQAFL